MSFDVELLDPVTKECLKLPYKHVMTGGTYQADYDPSIGTFSPMAIQEAELNITYNYAKFYFEAAEGDQDFYGERDEPGQVENCGIRAINGKLAADSIPMLERLIQRITEKYPGLETDPDYWAPTPGNAIKPLYQLLAMAKLRPDGVWWVE